MRKTSASRYYYKEHLGFLPNRHEFSGLSATSFNALFGDDVNKDDIDNAAVILFFILSQQITNVFRDVTSSIITC